MMRCRDAEMRGGAKTHRKSTTIDGENEDILPSLLCEAYGTNLIAGRFIDAIQNVPELNPSNAWYMST